MGLRSSPYFQRRTAIVSRSCNNAFSELRLEVCHEPKLHERSHSPGRTGGRIEKAGVFGSLFDNLSRFLIGNEDSAQRDPNSQPPVPIARSAPAEEAAVPAPAPPAMQGEPLAAVIARRLRDWGRTDIVRC